VTGLLLDGS